MTLRFGIAGYGVVGRRRHACLTRNDNAQLVAVCDQTFKESGVGDDGVHHHTNIKDLLRENLDALIVCLSNDVAAEVTIRGLEQGLHVFCEKPPGRDVGDIQRVMVSERLHPDCRLMYGFNHRYHESVTDALRIVRSGQLGSVINLRGVYGKAQLVTFNQSDWRTKREFAGGGVLLDQGIHMVDLMRLFGGEFEEVHSFVSNKYWGYDVEDNAYAIMRSADGVVAMLNSSATQWRHRFHLDVNLERGSLVLGGILSGTKSYGAETLTVVQADPSNDQGDPREVTTRYNRDPSWDAEIAEFISCITEPRPVRSGTSDEALRTMQLVYRIYHADEAWRTQFSIPDPDAF